jgi:hypothetical protein
MNTVISTVSNKNHGGFCMSKKKKVILTVVPVVLAITAGAIALFRKCKGKATKGGAWDCWNLK